MRVLHVIADGVMTSVVGLMILVLVRYWTETDMNAIDWLFGVIVFSGAVKHNIRREEKRVKVYVEGFGSDG